jgi:hypothetical protein
VEARGDARRRPRCPSREEGEERPGGKGPGRRRPPPSSAPHKPRVTNLDKLLASLEPHVALLPLEPGQRVALVEDLRAFVVEAAWA